jgi:hypothetical protein
MSELEHNLDSLVTPVAGACSRRLSHSKSVHSCVSSVATSPRYGHSLRLLLSLSLLLPLSTLADSAIVFGLQSGKLEVKEVAPGFSANADASITEPLHTMDWDTNYSIAPLTLSAGTLNINAQIALTDSDALSLTGSTALNLLAGSHIQTDTGALSLSLDAATWDGSIATNGPIIIQPATAADASLGGGATGLALSDADLAKLPASASSVTVIASGTIGLDTATFASDLQLTAAEIANSAGGTALTAPTATLAGALAPVDTFTVAANTTLGGDDTGNNRLVIDITNASMADQLAIIGTVTLDRVTLAGTLAYTPTPGDAFLILANDGADAISGTFSGLAQGDKVSLGGFDFSIDYFGGTGNDVVLTAVGASALTVQGNGITIFTDDLSPQAADNTEFPARDMNSQNVSQSFSILNGSAAAASVTGISSSNADFSASGIGFPATVPAGGNISFDITFAPTSEGQITGTISIATDVASQNPYSFAVEGIGIDPNIPPTANAGGPYIAQPNETIILDASGSTDPDNAIVLYEWDTDGDGDYDDVFGVNPPIKEGTEDSRLIGLRVTDASGDTDTAIAVLTIKQNDVLDWLNPVHVSSFNNTLTKSGGGANWTAGAFSRRALDEPGYLAVTASRGGKRMIGLSRTDTDVGLAGIEYAIYLNIASIEIYESGKQRGSYGTFNDGDELRITIEGRDIVYSKNGGELRRVVQAIAAGPFEYHADVSIESVGSSLSNIRLVTPNPEGPIITSYRAGDPDNLDTFYSAGDTVAIGFHQNTDQANQVGTLTKATVDNMFDFSPAPGLDYEGYWQDAATFVVRVLTPSETGPQIGSATVSVNGTIPIQNAKAPLPAASTPSPALSEHWGTEVILWLDPVNVLVEGNKLTRLFATNERWDSGAHSSRSVSGDCYFETVVTELGKNKMIGFGQGNDATIHDLDFGFFIHQTGSWELYHRGKQAGRLGNVGTGDTIRMQIDGSTMRYFKNGVEAGSSAIDSAAFPFKVDTSLQIPLATFNNTTLVIPDPDPPAIVSCVGGDPDNADTIFGNGDTFTVTFGGDTNMPSGAVKDLLTFSVDPGTLSGSWLNARTYVVTVDSAGSEPAIGSATVAPAGTVKIYAAGSRVEAAATSATISGHYGRTRNAIRVGSANGLTYDLARSYAISEVAITYSGANSAIQIQTSTDGSSFSTANSATLSAGSSIHDVFATGRYLRITGITSLDAIEIYTQAALPATTWDHVDLGATISNGSITASFQSGKPYEIAGLLSELPANLAAPTGSPVVVQTSTGTSVTTSYTYNDGSTHTITWDFDGGDLRCSTNTETQLPGLDLAGRTLVTVDADGRGVSSGTRSNHLRVALIEGASDGWVIAGTAGGSPAIDSDGSTLTTGTSELRIRSYTGDWRSAVTPFNLAAVSSPVRAYSTAINDALVPSQTLLGPLTNTTDIATAAAAGYVVVADLASVTEADALTAGASVLYSTSVPANPATDYMSDTLTSGAKFALFDSPGHPLGGYLFKGAIIVAPTGSMYAPTALADIDEFIAFGCYLPAYGVDSWNEIVAAAQANDLAPADIVYETTATTRSMLYNATNYGTRHTGITSYSGAGAIPNWKFYTGSTHIGLDTSSTYYFDPALSLDGAASHFTAVPADFALASQSNDSFTKIVLSGNGDLDSYVAVGDSVFLDVEMPYGNGVRAIAGSVTVRMVTDSNTLIHGSVTSDTLIGRFPAAGGINLVGSGNGTVTINALEVYNGNGAFNIDLAAYSNQNVLIEFSGSFTARDIILTAAPPVADIGGPYSTTEGAGISLSASNSFNAVTYLWDFDNDGSHDDATGATPNFVTNVDGTYPISLRIENGGQFDIANSTITVSNVAPIADIGGPYAGAPGTTIALSATGSSDPGGDIASYAWDFDGDGFDDATGATASFTPLASGSITIRVQVTDDDGASSIASAILYASNDVVFTAVNSLDVSGNDLSRSTGTGWNASAISVGALEEDGYMGFTGTIAGKAMIGLSENDTGAHFSGMPYAFYKNINRVEIYELGRQRGSYGTFENGDTFRITIDKGDVVYSHNGSELRRIIGAVPLEGFSFNADVAVEARGTTVQDVVLVIPPPENPEITDYEGFDVDNLDTVYGADDIVSITFHQKTDMAGYAQDQVLLQAQVDELFTFNPAPAAAYTGYWSHPAIFVVNIVTPAATAPQFGSATVQTAGTRPIYNAKTPLLATTDPGTLAGHWGSVVVLWTNPVGVLVDGNKLTRPSSGPERWDAGAASSRTFTGDGYMESIVNVSGKNRMIGFSASDSDQHFASLDFAIFLHASGNAEAYELGVQRGNLGRYKAGDTIRVERRGSEIRYLLNGLPRRVTTVSPTLGLKVDCSLNARGSVFNNTILVLPDSVITASRATPSEPNRDAITLHLDSGWNLIGIPLDLDDPTPAFLYGATAEAGRAYWVHNPRAPYSIVLTGTQPATQPPITGDLYAPIRTSPTPTGATAWTYTSGAWRLASGPLEPGTGYLLRK